MTQNKKPGADDTTSLLPVGDSLEEFKKKKVSLGNPTPTLIKKTDQAPATPVENSDPIGWHLLYQQLLRKSKPLIPVLALIFFILLSRFLNLGPFGVRSFVLLSLIIYLAWLYIWPKRSGEEPNMSWIKFTLVPTVLIGFFEITFLWQQHVATELTKEISGNPNAWVQCQRFTPALFADALTAGYYAPAQNSDRSVVQYIYCKEWSNFYYSDKNSIEDMQILWSVGTVIHEAIHVSGELNEAVTQCLTHKAFPQVLRNFGVSEDKITEYATRYHRGAQRMPAAYLNGVCDKHPLISRVPHIFAAQ